MHVKDTLVARRHQFFGLWQFQHIDSGFELISLLTIVEIVANNISSFGIILFKTFHFHFDILPCHRERQSLIFCVEDLLNGCLSSRRQNSDSLVFDDGACLDFTVKVQVSHLSELINHRNSQWSHRFSFGQRVVVKKLQQRRTFVPTVLNWFMNVYIIDWVEWNESDIVESTGVL